MRKNPTRHSKKQINRVVPTVGNHSGEPINYSHSTPRSNFRKGLSPTLVARASICAHSWYLECHGNEEDKVEADAGLRLMWEQGLLHEQAMIRTLPGYEEPVWDGKDWDAGFKATLELMKKGVEWIYQGVLVRGDLYGKPEFPV